MGCVGIIIKKFQETQVRTLSCFLELHDNNSYTGCILKVEAHSETHFRNWLSESA